MARLDFGDFLDPHRYAAWLEDDRFRRRRDLALARPKRMPVDMAPAPRRAPAAPARPAVAGLLSGLTGFGRNP